MYRDIWGCIGVGLGFRVQVPNNQMGGCQNYDPFLGTLNIRCRISQKGTIILTITHILTQNLYHNYYYPKPKYLIVGYMDPKP